MDADYSSAALAALRLTPVLLGPCVRAARGGAGRSAHRRLADHPLLLPDAPTRRTAGTPEISRVVWTVAGGSGGSDPTGKAGYRQLLGYVRPWPRRSWAVEDAHGVGRPPAAEQAETLLASVRPRDLPGQTRPEPAVELAAEVQALDGKLTTLTRRLPRRSPRPGLG